MNVTIRIDETLLRNVNRYAERRGQSVSELVEAQLRLMLRSQSDIEVKPVSSRLRGIVSLPNDFDYKQELENRTLWSTIL